MCACLSVAVSTSFIFLIVQFLYFERDEEGPEAFLDFEWSIINYYKRRVQQPNPQPEGIGLTPLLATVFSPDPYYIL